MKSNLKRIIFAGIAGGLALNIAMLLTFRLLGFGWQGNGILLNPSIQSPKLIAVWTQLQPIPLVISKPFIIFTGLVIFSIGHAAVYHWLSPSWQEGIKARALRFAMLLFFLSFLFWEFLTPFNMLGEPLVLIPLELVFWTAMALAESLTIAAVMEIRK